ncbi:precorrin-2 C(20)-methyltransferase [Roseobacter sp. HKCCD9010]|uniref:precorrin-2 C(20)-methyltransferase n=1 Tax=unclassified Roseobacter TaxID=196798 RepID=UPI001490AD07|nr:MULTISPECIES: precorrin-2 C(20)-methyltransferase [unclassified Roseobacter]MBF9051949.1 precorrin-2 C(20)-methyltransferase [Rhodobacterales bacterium HKCCD4356]NNV13942.1 precorrin-2 C(20)-methyltransferase [Roseobacter sp. HKCCD7357]NNV18114.1 precorrin-2 C(20)-methyltransferase [Roseobacter sp. HKCCD8768]NNV27574.1 precorrin-2 C(20)-methyltransferase [Roseobacter sp. HKCCD8192]NNV31840.1 precorrin-2 C(20)-methyltransferase [Roseobacter sp. HKCCD9061]
MTRSPGTIWGVGLGPGDPDLMSVRADRLVRGAKHVAFFRKAGRPGRARSIIEGMLRQDVIEIPMEYPVTTEIPLDDPSYNACLSGFYAEIAARLKGLAQSGEDVVVLCEGDPFFYGSFMHLHIRLKEEVSVRVVPAITGMSAAWTATDVPITWGDDVLTVLLGTMREDDLIRRMEDADAIVVMKVGRNLPKVRHALSSAGKLDHAWLVECASMTEERAIPLAEAGDKASPYFSIVMVHGQGRRP